ncbi:MAG: HAD family hydrolase [Lachnospiraceae bacterium]|nr:HAD family hydrolase [Lachnospiraceae bacterium]
MSVFDYKAVVWDLDGTLYYQRRMRLRMALSLLTYYLTHPLRLKELFAVKKFREVREHWEDHMAGDKELVNKTLKENRDCDELSVKQYLYVAKSLNTEFSLVKDAVTMWIYQRPLDIIYECRDKDAAELIAELREKGIDNYIFSDYPIEDKLKALKIKGIKGCYSATDHNIAVLKPDPKGLKLIMEENDHAPSQVLMIGDRMSKDGEAAKKAGCDYYILPKSRYKRKKIYSLIR